MPLSPAQLQANQRLLQDSSGHPVASRSYTATTAITFYADVVGCARWRVRMKATTAGTLSFAYCRPVIDAGDRVAPTAYSASNPADVAVSANTEAVAEDEHFGEDLLKITFTPAAQPGTYNYLDISRV